MNNLNFENKEIVYTKFDKSFMLMNVSIIKLTKNETYTLLPNEFEKAIDLLEGELKINILNKDIEKNILFKRKNVFHDKPSALITDKNGRIEFTCLSENAKMIYQSIKNKNEYGFRIFEKDKIEITYAGINESDGVAKRRIIEFFSHNSLPESNLVMGEVVGEPGSWSGWPPHTHYQPEMYLFKFNKENGFGASFVGEDVYKVFDEDAVCIPGNLIHPAVSSPGYIMWYSWMIPNLENNPWTERKYDTNYIWTKENDVERSTMEDE